MTEDSAMRTTLTGTVVAAGRMTRTITVEVERSPWHKKVQKQFRRSKRFLVDDQKGEGRVGDQVKIEQTRPLSKRKHFRLVSVLQRGAVVFSGDQTTEKP